MRYAIATGRAERDPAADLRGALMPHVKKHRPALTTPEKVGRLMHAIYNYQGSLVVRSALQIMALTFCRTTEIRCAEWREFDFEDNIWRIPAERMKMRRDHLVPLSKNRRLAVLEKPRAYSGGNQYVFPSYRSESIPFGKTALSAGPYAAWVLKKMKRVRMVFALWHPLCSMNSATTGTGLSASLPTSPDGTDTRDLQPGRIPAGTHAVCFRNGPTIWTA